MKAKRQAKRAAKAPVKAAKKARRKAVIKKVVNAVGKAVIPPAARLLVQANRKRADRLVKQKAAEANVSPTDAAIMLTEETPEIKENIRRYVQSEGVTPSENTVNLIAQAGGIREYKEANAMNLEDIPEDEVEEVVEDDDIQEGMEENFDPASIVSVASNVIKQGKAIVQKINDKRAAKGKRPILQSKKKAAKIAQQSKAAANVASAATNLTDVVKGGADASALSGGQTAKEAINKIIEDVKDTETKKWIGENFIWIVLVIAVLFYVGRASK